MSRYWIPAMIAATVFSANAFADHGWDDGEHWRHRHHRHVEQVIVQPVYAAPQVVYEAPPQVVYRERVVYRDRPVYYEAAPVYAEPPRYAAPAPTYSSPGGNHVVGQAIGAVAGGVIGNRFGQGNGRVAATAVGAVLGSVVGGRLADSTY